MAAHVMSIRRGAWSFLQRIRASSFNVRASTSLVATPSASIHNLPLTRRCSTSTTVTVATTMDEAGDEASCSGCGSIFHSSVPQTQGYLPPNKMASLLESDAPSDKPVICQRCFYLRHYNNPLHVTLPPDDYLKSLSHLKDEKCLVLVIIDGIDFPSSLFPSLRTLLNPQFSKVYLVINKIDVLPLMDESMKIRFESYIKTEAEKSIDPATVIGIHYVSAKTGQGVGFLTDSITTEWGNRGNVYLLGCTNVGKSSLFKLLLQSLCGVQPGQLKTVNEISAPSPTISHWPGTTIGLIKFPMLSVGKRKRLSFQAHKKGITVKELIVDQYAADDDDDDDQFAEVVSSKRVYRSHNNNSEVEEVLKDIGINRKKKKKEEEDKNEEKGLTLPENRHWLHDTPGAVNDIQATNHLTTNELRLMLPKKRLSPRTIILKEGQSVFLGGLARLDYIQGKTSAYFTIFTSSYLPIHTRRTRDADEMYKRHLGQPLLKVPVGDAERIDAFPPLEPEELIITGRGFSSSVCDIILSSVGWVCVTAGLEHEIKILAYTPNGKGIFMRSPSLFPTAVTERGKRSKKGNKTYFKGKKK
ncbi:PREDICTED: nitric oxide-associated protein 1-like [Amphimedon queenslandica]|uniref:NOA1/YqeH-like C-terminal domain-containing protein n=1 Tax=Amphimedon queenslandica TaxID=400682 RepID=A0A1X7VKU0_AMPQE|nr:PREDICTED: nitric oxide-associated protein 1-like [Amphimedon queenslandica]|eukprot:XP_003383934.1 PREDICTED: nitric oxide-associated protein 1-like [Amphimedon queenslandica]